MKIVDNEISERQQSSKCNYKKCIFRFDYLLRLPKLHIVFDVQRGERVREREIHECFMRHKRWHPRQNWCLFIVVQADGAPQPEEARDVCTIKRPRLKQQVLNCEWNVCAGACTDDGWWCLRHQNCQCNWDRHASPLLSSSARSFRNEIYTSYEKRGTCNESMFH